MFKIVFLILNMDKSVKNAFFIPFFYVLNVLKIALKDLLFDFFLLFFYRKMYFFMETEKVTLFK